MHPSRASYQHSFGGGPVQQTRAPTNQPAAGGPVTSTGLFFNNGPLQLNRNPPTTVSAGNKGSSQQSTTKIIPPPSSFLTQTSHSQEASQQFKAAPLHLSVTRDSDVSSNDDKNDSSHFARDDPSQFARDVTSQSTLNRRDNSEAEKIAESENQKQKDEMVIIGYCKKAYKESSISVVSVLRHFDICHYLLVMDIRKF